MLEALKEDVAEFLVMRSLGLRFQGLLRHRDARKLERWIVDAKGCGIPAIVNFVRALMHDIQAVRNAVIEPWSNGQTEGQINRLKTLKRSMFGRADIRLLRARMMPLAEIVCHQIRG